MRLPNIISEALCHHGVSCLFAFGCSLPLTLCRDHCSVDTRPHYRIFHTACHQLGGCATIVLRTVYSEVSLVGFEIVSGRSHKKYQRTYGRNTGWRTPCQVIFMICRNKMLVWAILTLAKKFTKTFPIASAKFSVKSQSRSRLEHRMKLPIIQTKYATPLRIWVTWISERNLVGLTVAQQGL